MRKFTHCVVALSLFCAKMDINVLFMIIIGGFATVSASMVNLTSVWRADFGWEITCSWKLLENDSLQSVRLMDHERQFLVYRPETNGPRYRQTYQLPETYFNVECYETSERGVMGQCVMTMELFKPITDDMKYSCEVSGERPKFMMEKRDIEIAALVPPSDAVIDVAQRGPSGSRVILNCTASGLSAPSLLWYIGEQKVPQDFDGKTWNRTSKLWHSWSLLSYSTTDTAAICVAETNKGGKTFKGRRTEYSTASGRRGTISVILIVLFILALTR